MYLFRHLGYLALTAARRVHRPRFWTSAAWYWLVYDGLSWTRDAVMQLVPGSRAIECECCGWRGQRFFLHTFVSNMTVHRFKQEICPRCESLPRQRQLVMYLVEANIRVLHKPAILDIGPGKADLAWLRGRGFDRLVTVDIQPGAMARMDITRLGFKDNAFDVVICSHVLEHVPDDVGASRELSRVLKLAGLGIIQVPIDPCLAETVEYGRPNPDEFDHVRKYGRDFGDRLRAAGIVLAQSGEGLYRIMHVQAATRARGTGS